ncbi:hypothetical protein HNR06_004240 [Nocardiopsis arvandica]|uniref:Uncharacterized protein n=1 Tax=Nocardiopsis sinuspersici TaxID=501010 RepID=A0A7Y9XF70_9ACTN|nr:hypothetical protein [Nocardiopsis sinuspersici]
MKTRFLQRIMIIFTCRAWYRLEDVCFRDSGVLDM